MMRKLFVLVLLACALPLSWARGEDLVTRDGTVYHNYKVLGHDAGYLTIMDSDGGGKIPLSNLPDDLQKKYGYNKQQADAAVQAAVEQDRQDRLAIARQEAAQHPQAATPAQAPAQAQTQIQTQAAPTAVASPTVPAPSVPSAPVTDVPTVSAPVPLAGTQLTAPSPSTQTTSPEEVAALKSKIADMRGEMLRLKTGGTELVINSDPYLKQLSKDGIQLSAMRIQLSQLETTERRKTLTWADINKIHGQIVGLDDEIGAFTPDEQSEDTRKQVIAADKIDDDTDGIAELRQTIELSPKEPIQLSPNEVAGKRQKIADLNAEIVQLNAKTSDDMGFAGRDHTVHEDTEDIAFLQDELNASGSH